MAKPMERNMPSYYERNHRWLLSILSIVMFAVTPQLLTLLLVDAGPKGQPMPLPAWVAPLSVAGIALSALAGGFWLRTTDTFSAQIACVVFTVVLSGVWICVALSLFPLSFEIVMAVILATLATLFVVQLCRRGR